MKNCVDCYGKVSTQSTARCRKCADKFKKGINHPNFSKVLTKCDACQGEYYMHKFRLKLYKNHFCSRPCSRKFKTDKPVPHLSNHQFTKGQTAWNVGRNDYITPELLQKFSEVNKRHGMSKRSRFYRVWDNMRYRCNTPTCKMYPNYGGRGIKVCDRWNIFENFRDDMYSEYLKAVETYGEGHVSINRIDNDGNYSPENCEWTNELRQMNNTRATRFVSLYGINRGVSEWAKDLNINPRTVHSRLKCGWPIEKAFFHPIRKKTK